MSDKQPGVYALATIHPDGEFLINPDDPDPFLEQVANIMGDRKQSYNSAIGFMNPTQFVRGVGPRSLVKIPNPNFFPESFPMELPKTIGIGVTLPIAGMLTQIAKHLLTSKQRELVDIAARIKIAHENMEDTFFKPKKPVGVQDDSGKKKKRCWIHVRTEKKKWNEL